MLKLKFKKYQGASLPISMFVLLGLTISSAALFNSTESNVQISGSVGLRSITSQANDTTVSTAIQWLLDNQKLLKNSNKDAGYQSSYIENYLDYDNEASWAGSKTIATDTLGNQSRYIIYRLCSISDVAYNGSLNGTSNVCATKIDASSSNAGNSSGFGAYNFTSQPTLFYKIVVQTKGPKNAKTTTSTIVGLKSS